MKRVGIIGHFAFSEEYLDGQTIKTQNVAAELDKRFGENEVIKFDTHGMNRKIWMLPRVLLKGLKQCSNIIIMPAQNGLCIMTPFLIFGNMFFKRKIHYVVIGGWLPMFLERKKWLRWLLRKVDLIYPETKIMGELLGQQGLSNVRIMPNCKQLDILELAELQENANLPYRLCTFSRVMKEKGIEEAIAAVHAANEALEAEIFTLDIYGQVDAGQQAWFQDLKAKMPSYVKYCGTVAHDKSTEVLKQYQMLLFPTYYEGEGFAGTLIDALAAGVPVIASDWRYNAEIIKDGETGFVCPVNDVEAFSKAIVRVYKEGKKIMQMKRCCIQEASKYLPSCAMDVLVNEIV